MLAHAGPDHPPLPITVSRLLGSVELQPLVVLPLLLTAAVYLLGVRTLARRGDHWPVNRTLFFVGGGVGVVAVALVSGLAVYDDTSFAAHMGQHMLLTMVAPVFLALGAPVTLALRTLPALPRRWLLGVLHSRVAAVVGFPLVGWLVFVGTPFALYFSGWYPASLDNDWLHAATHVHVLLGGCLFFFPMLGLDPVPGRLPYPFRLLLTFAVLPFHAFLGIAIMSRNDLIAAGHYLGVVGRSPAAALADQHVGGGLLWASGDLVGLLFLGALAVQWMRADERQAVRDDRRLDRADRAAARVARGEDADGPRESAADQDAREQAELDAWNARLAALSGRGEP